MNMRRKRRGFSSFSAFGFPCVLLAVVLLCVGQYEAAAWAGVIGIGCLVVYLRGPM